MPENKDTYSDSKSSYTSSISSKEIDRDILHKVQEYCSDKDFENDFNNFALEHYEDFKECLHLTPDDEHPIHFYDIFKKFVQFFESKIEKFLEDVI